MSNKEKRRRISILSLLSWICLLICFVMEYDIELNSGTEPIYNNRESVFETGNRYLKFRLSRRADNSGPLFQKVTVSTSQKGNRVPDPLWLLSEPAFENGEYFFPLIDQDKD